MATSRQTLSTDSKKVRVEEREELQDQRRGGRETRGKRHREKPTGLSEAGRRDRATEPFSRMGTTAEEGDGTGRGSRRAGHGICTNIGHPCPGSRQALRSADLPVHVEKKQVCCSVRMRTGKLSVGFCLVWRLLLYFPNSGGVVSLTFSPSSGLRNGIEKGSAPPAPPPPTPSPLSETPAGVPHVGTKSAGTTSRRGV